MPHKNKLERATEQKKFKPLVVNVTDDENFNWLHSIEDSGAFSMQADRYLTIGEHCAG